MRRTSPTPKSPSPSASAARPLSLFPFLSSAQESVTFNYTGSVQTYTVPPCVNQLQVVLKGGAGGGANGGNGANAVPFASRSCGGGGASDIRVAPYNLGNRIAVAAKADASPDRPERAHSVMEAVEDRRLAEDLVGRHGLAAATAGPMARPATAELVVPIPAAATRRVVVVVVADASVVAAVDRTA